MEMRGLHQQEEKRRQNSGIQAQKACVGESGALEEIQALTA